MAVRSFACVASVAVLAAAAAPPTPPVPAAPADEVAALVKEFNLPPVNPVPVPPQPGASGGAKDLAATAPGPARLDRLSYTAAALRTYAADVSPADIVKPENRGTYPLRVAVLDAFRTIREVWGGADEHGLRTEFIGPNSDELKKQVFAEQMFPAEAIAKLEAVVLRLEQAADRREKETKRWQAHYDYALAQCHTRLVFLYEYNTALAHIRTESLPSLDAAKGENALRLVPTAKLLGKSDVKALAKRAAALYDRIAAAHPGTPWAAAAARDEALALGLRWVPFAAKVGKAD